MEKREKWTGKLVGRMHVERVSQVDLAAELGCTKAYVSMILSGIKKPAGIQQRMENALDAIIARRRETV